MTAATVASTSRNGNGETHFPVGFKVSPEWFDNRERYVPMDRGYECWVWTMSVTEGGYGRVGVGPGNRRHASAHVLYWEREHGPVPDGLELDHLCRVRRCVNPDHMEPVTRAENLRRRPRRYRLTVGDVRAIRASGESGAVLAREFGVSRTTISHVRLGHTWADIPMGGGSA